jgi:arginase
LNEVDANTGLYWEKLKRIAASGLQLLPEHLVYFGVRDTEPSEDALMNKLGIKNYTVAEVRDRGVKYSAQEALERLKGCDLLYVSFDVDSIDSELIGEGTGTPVPEGFTPVEVRSLLREFSQTDQLISLELVEVNPLLDKKGNQTAEVAFSILEHITPLISGVVTSEREQLFR